jgi:photosystem II stability/assembly factor-like uncharacterized protein
MATNLLAGQASLWIQPDGPNTEPKYLGCHSVGDLAEPKGDETILYCPDPAQAGRFTPKNSFTGEPGSVTATVETDLRKTADYLEDIGKCGLPVYIHKVSCGRRDVFTNFDRTFILNPAKVTNASLGNLAARDPANEAESTQSFDLSSLLLIRGFPMEANRVSISDTENITGIAICGEERCEGDCGASQSEEDYIYLATEALAASAANVANVLVSVAGAAFAATAADPFAGGEDIQGIQCFRVGRDTIRVLVARGTTDAGNPAEVAYSDDNGATWTAVDVGSTNGEYVSNGHALFALDRYHIWLGTDGGRIYFSNDGGVTWTVQESAVISATDVTGISFADGDIGFAVYTGGEVASTTDGSTPGATWSQTGAVSGSVAALDIHAVSSYFVWVAGSDGLFYTHDAGDTWAERGAYAIAAVDFLNELEGMAVGSASSGLIYQTIDGGYDWQPLAAITNTGWLDVKMIRSKLGYASGNATGGTGMLAKLLPEA